MTYYDIPMPVRCLVILGLFFLVCLGGYLTPARTCLWAAST